VRQQRGVTGWTWPECRRSPARIGHHQRPGGRARSKRYKYQALVTPVPREADDQEALLRGPVCRVVVRASHHETHHSKLFSALVTSEEGQQPGRSSVMTMVVVGNDADDYLTPGEHFALLRGREVARGTVTRRLYV